MSVFERIAQRIGYTFNVHIAKSQSLKYIPESYIIIGLIILAALTIGTIIYLQKKRKN